MTSTVPKTTLTVPGVSLARVIASESVKFRSLRSTIALLIGAVILIVGAGPAMVTLVAEPMAAADWNPGRDPFSPHDPAAAVLYGVLFAQLPIGVLGVLIASSEYGTGMIRATLAAVPTRLPVLWAKVTVTGLVSFVLMLAATIAAYLIGQGIFASAGVELDLSDPDVLRALVGAPLYLAGVGVLAVTLGFLLRNTAVAISTFFIFMFFLSPLLGLLLPGDIGYTVASYLLGRRPVVHRRDAPNRAAVALGRARSVRRLLGGHGLRRGVRPDSA